jgi:uncharacterized protein
MDSSILYSLSRACAKCDIGGRCCFEARPPLTEERIRILMDNGVRPDQIDRIGAGYKRLGTRPDGFCTLFKDGRCSIHSVKPETCIAGPFTFDVKGAVLEIYLKREKICPMVAFLKENRKVYDELFEAAVENIMKLLDGIPQSELAEIIKIDEPDTDIVAEIRLKRRLL